ncbi:DUF7940 domain-containing protein [Acinetobacter pragensis]|uniref:Uncharacterized protein n=1 Tax=Acinetobacter pragensis TaxID=1806892 RepID=A0A151Y233_9GAMM|nr:hypothetical protein [Acinetobacter pragensis]KYQ72065.1 hypothetical protein AZH43_12690 [Acinetobacter pragensis]
MPSKVKNNLAQLAKVERYIARFQLLSNIHERTLTEHNDQLDFTWKDGYETGVRDANALHGVAKQTAAEAESAKIQQLRLQLSTRESELDQKALELSDAKQKLLDQAKRHQQRIDELKAEIAQNPEPIAASLGFTTYAGPIVENWRDSWKWISNWCFGLIVFFATTPIPPELLMVLPENVRTYLIAWTAFCGLIGRYINQSKGIKTWPLKS